MPEPPRHCREDMVLVGEGPRDQMRPPGSTPCSEYAGLSFPTDVDNSVGNHTFAIRSPAGNLLVSGRWSP